MFFTAGLTTDKGTVKEINQDSMMLKVAKSKEFGRIAFGLVCDGCGGLSYGEIASASYVRRMEDWFYNELPGLLSNEDDTRKLDESNFGRHDPIELIKGNWTYISTEMNEKLYEYGAQKHASVGTTVCMLIILGNEYLAMNIGDSRIYRFSNRKVSCITHDHSYIQKQLDEGRMTAKQALVSPMKSVLLQCVGAAFKVDPYYSRGVIDKDETFLLCCDGFWRMTSQNDFARIMNVSDKDSEDAIEESLREQVEKLKRDGESDNISAILVRARDAI
ncbi:MAG: serine/threonine-protein phosphatase [Butyrivibrio sp.]|uniref:PP2C family protein-serine/threonine phosphatase n=1 Tax=Butyrivibrio sp. TaxID=28121 RepID=UPI0025D7A9BB|nr:PP2C family serine/threonine-protein phosphatase [Butyrivibrio sp.]MCR5772999.1 serine/threonine-protein phosphatase [Butyrivibrio sp.]